MDLMKVNGRDMDDLIAELYSAADMVAFMAHAHLNEEVTSSEQVIGSALSGIENYIRRITDDIQEMEEKRVCA